MRGSIGPSEVVRRPVRACGGRPPAASDKHESAAEALPEPVEDRPGQQQMRDISCRRPDDRPAQDRRAKQPWRPLDEAEECSATLAIARREREKEVVPEA